MILVGWVMILLGVGLFAWEGLMWLRDGYWTRSTLADLWGRWPVGGQDDDRGWAAMRGVHLIFYGASRWLGHAPTSLALVVLGLASAWVGNGALVSAEEDKARRARRASSLFMDGAQD